MAQDVAAHAAAKTQDVIRSSMETVEAVGSTAAQAGSTFAGSAAETAAAPGDVGRASAGAAHAASATDPSTTRGVQTTVHPVQGTAPADTAAESLLSQEHPGANRMQLIDEHQHLHAKAFQKTLAEWGMADVGFGYDICAVLGSQSTGKSTLLNKLFSTNFDVMNETKRQQTTKGIWLCRGNENNVLVMDVEGTDGRERGEDQDFERKSALFALTTAECLIVNMWENQVGLYQGANMGLLKTVLDVNLSLFQAGRARTGGAQEKTMLLFIIRDFIGTTPLENLRATVLTDLDRIWDSLSKPANLTDAKLSDFFDVSFTALPHKLLMAREFDASIDLLRARFYQRNDPNYVFQTQYHKRIPIDGLPRYLEGVWDQIVQNKDLDLPTQQELLAQFRCDEIAEAALLVFTEAVQTLRKVLDAGKVRPALGTDIAAYRTAALEAFDKDASRYHQGVYVRKRAELLSKLNALLLPNVHMQLKNLHTQLMHTFRSAVLDVVRSGAPYHFSQAVDEQSAAALAQFDEAAAQLLLPDTEWSLDEERALLTDEIRAQATALRTDECRKMALAMQRQMRKKLADPVEMALAQPSGTMWDAVLKSFFTVLHATTAAYLARAETFASTEAEKSAGAHAMQRAGWQQLMDKVHEQTADAVLSGRLRGFFEERFRYDDEGVPRVWSPTDDIDGLFTRARDATLALIPLYARITPSDPHALDEIRESVEEASFQAAVHDGTEEPIEVDAALTVLSERQANEVGARFRKDADALYVEAKRSTVSGMSQVPLWMYGVMLLLGWNELMAVLRSPIYFTLLCMSLTAAYVVWRLNMGSQVVTMAKVLSREVQKLVEDQLRTYLVPPAAPAAPQRGEKQPVAVAQ